MLALGCSLKTALFRRGRSGRHGNSSLHSNHFPQLVCRMTSAEERLTAHEASSREEAQRLQTELDKYARSTCASLHVNDLVWPMKRSTQATALLSLHQHSC